MLTIIKAITDTVAVMVAAGMIVVILFNVIIRLF